MTRDYARKPTRKKSRGKTNKKKPTNSGLIIPTWASLLSGIAIGFFLGFLVFLSDVPPEKTAATVAQKTEETHQTEANEPDFSFYTLLPEREVIVPQEETQPEVSNKPRPKYLLQAGSFRQLEDANRRRAQLILLDLLDARVETVKGKNGESWHRVITGPFVSRSKLAKARNDMISEGIDTLLISARD